MRILCLHGYCQNAGIFRSKTAALRKSLARDAGAELVYVDAPHGVDEASRALRAAGTEPASASEVTAGAPGDPPPGNQTRKCWWNASRDGAVYVGWHETICYLSNIFREQGPFEGILGFSQGATLTHLICALAAFGGGGSGSDGGQTEVCLASAAGAARSDSDTTADNASEAAAKMAVGVASETAASFASLRFAILISGFPSRSPAHSDLMVTTRQKHCEKQGTQRNFAPLSIPAFHMWGSADELVPPAASSLLARQYAEATRQALVHDGGHFVPGSADVRRQMAAFVAQFRATSELECSPEELPAELT